MLGKLIKHDFRALSRTLFPLQLGILAAAIMATIFMTVNIRLTDLRVNDGVLFVFTGISAMLMAIVGFAIVASMLVTLLVICVQYYRNLLGEQGYLTFTLPVTTGRIIFSKLVTGMIWIAINAVVVFIAVLIFAVFGTASKGLMNPEVLSTLRSAFTNMPDVSDQVHVGLIVIEVVVLVILALAETLLQAYFAIAIGGRAAKHRLLASIGMYIALSMGVNIIRTIVTLCFSIGPVGLLNMAATIDTGVWFVHSALLWNCGLSLALSAAFFFSTRAILKNKLNLQ